MNKLQKHKIFSYTPRYYDPKREKFKHIHKKHEVITDEEYAAGKRRATALRDNWKSERTKGDATSRRIRLYVIFMILCVIAYYAFKKFDFSRFI